MALKLAIVGRPNVGKSTLFNRLVGKRLALVDDRPGVTRDRRYAEGNIGDMDLTLIDTAGYEDVTDDSLESRMREQTEAAFRSIAWRGRHLVIGFASGPIPALPLNLAAIALGMGLWKARMLAGEWRTFRLQRIAGLSALAAIPALLALAWWLMATGFPAALVGPAALVLSAPFDTLLAAAYAALAMAFLGGDSRLSRRLAMVGRLSLSNYLMTSVILAAIFAPWGLGLFGEVTRTQAFALGLVPIAAMLAWSPLWVARLGQGPFERLWRAAAGVLR